MEAEMERLFIPIPGLLREETPVTPANAELKKYDSVIK